MGLNDRGNKTDSEVRKHYYLDRYVVIAPGHHGRPKELSNQTGVSQKPFSHHPVEASPSILEIPSPDGTSWSVKVIANPYPAFSPGNAKARGQQELVLETSRPATPFHKLSVTEIENVLAAYQHRVRDLRLRYAYVSVFKNHGRMAGASLGHTHSQIIATGLVPPEVSYERTVLTQYQDTHKTSPLCDVVRWELAERIRVIAHTRYTTTICPYASQFPLEVWIIPNRQSHSIVDLVPEEIHSLGDHLKGAAAALGNNGIDYNYHFQESIPGAYNHSYIKVTPRISIHAGFELNTGIHINPVSPEFSVRWYQKHIKTPDAV